MPYYHNGTELTCVHPISDAQVPQEKTKNINRKILYYGYPSLACSRAFWFAILLFLCLFWHVIHGRTQNTGTVILQNRVRKGSKWTSFNYSTGQRASKFVPKPMNTVRDKLALPTPWPPWCCTRFAGLVHPGGYLPVARNRYTAYLPNAPVHPGSIQESIKTVILLKAIEPVTMLKIKRMSKGLLDSFLLELPIIS